jgi:hypothetical protein
MCEKEKGPSKSLLFDGPFVPDCRTIAAENCVCPLPADKLSGEAGGQIENNLIGGEKQHKLHIFSRHPFYAEAG